MDFHQKYQKQVGNLKMFGLGSPNEYPLLILAKKNKVPLKKGLRFDIVDAILRAS